MKPSPHLTFGPTPLAAGNDYPALIPTWPVDPQGSLPPLHVHAEHLPPGASLHVEMPARRHTMVPGKQGEAHATLRIGDLEPGLHVVIAVIIARNDDGELILLHDPVTLVFRIAARGGS